MASLFTVGFRVSDSGCKVQGLGWGCTVLSFEECIVFCSGLRDFSLEFGAQGSSTLMRRPQMLSTYMVECRVSILGMTIMIQGSIPHNSTQDPLGLFTGPETLSWGTFPCFRKLMFQELLMRVKGQCVQPGRPSGMLARPWALGLAVGSLGVWDSGFSLRLKGHCLLRLGVEHLDHQAHLPGTKRRALDPFHPMQPPPHLERQQNRSGLWLAVRKTDKRRAKTANPKPKILSPKR